MPRLGSDETDLYSVLYTAQRVDLGDRQDPADKRSRLRDDDAGGIRNITSSRNDDAHTGTIEEARVGEIYREIPWSLRYDFVDARFQISSREDVDFTADGNDRKE
jgi:hypothetical protein